jgi:hypothetical protein
MNRIIFITTICMMLTSFKGFSQTEITKQEFDSLKRAVIKLDGEIGQINYNLVNAKRSLKTGILVATIGYTVTIIGGQLLGVNPKLGEALLYTGGAIGIGGTVVLIRGFNKISLGPPRKKP